MTEKGLRALADRYQAKADRAYMRYQETGLPRDDRVRRNAEDLADALRMAADAADEHALLICTRSELYQMATYAQGAGGDPVKLETLRQTVLIVARTHGLIGEEDKP